MINDCWVRAFINSTNALTTVRNDRKHAAIINALTDDSTYNAIYAKIIELLRIPSGVQGDVADIFYIYFDKFDNLKTVVQISQQCMCGHNKKATEQHIVLDEYVLAPKTIICEKCGCFSKVHSKIMRACMPILRGAQQVPELSKYKLKAVVMFSGSDMSGHYWVIAYENNGTYRCDGKSKELVTEPVNVTDDRCLYLYEMAD